jgi:hypothetical protein
MCILRSEANAPALTPLSLRCSAKNTKKIPEDILRRYYEAYTKTVMTNIKQQNNKIFSSIYIHHAYIPITNLYEDPTWKVVHFLSRSADHPRVLSTGTARPLNTVLSRQTWMSMKRRQHTLPSPQRSPPAALDFLDH